MSGQDEHAEASQRGQARHENSPARGQFIAIGRVVKHEDAVIDADADDQDCRNQVEQVQAQLNYAQKLISVLQGKVNEANGQLVQFEARLMLAEEDKQNILKQIEPLGISPQ